MYYLQSRYYNPEWGRFINADALGGSVGELFSHNIFAYCKNNHINKFDPDGYREIARTSLSEETDEQRADSIAKMRDLSRSNDSIVYAKGGKSQQN